MPYSIITNEDDRFTIVFAKEPSFVAGFPMAPEHREEALNYGKWLMLVFAIWNANDRLAIDRALKVTKTFNGKFKLGVRPYERGLEFATWISEAAVPETTTHIHETKNHQESDEISLLLRGNSSSTPVWLWLDSGKLIGSHCGFMADGDVERFVTHCLAQTMAN